MIEFQDTWQVGGRGIFEQVRTLLTTSQIPASVPGGSASHSLVQISQQALHETFWACGVAPPQGEMAFYQGALIQYFHIEIPLAQAQDFSTLKNT